MHMSGKSLSMSKRLVLLAGYSDKSNLSRALCAAEDIQPCRPAGLYVF
jgi:hypothetical protein